MRIYRNLQMNSDGWIFEPDYQAICRHLLGLQASQADMDLCKFDELYMYRIIAQHILRVQPDLLSEIMQNYLNEEALQTFVFDVGAQDQSMRVDIEGSRKRPESLQSEDVQDGTQLESRQVISYYENLSGVSEQNLFDRTIFPRIVDVNRDLGVQGDTENVTTEKNTLATLDQIRNFYGRTWPPYAALHIRATDNMGRWRHGPCDYATRLDMMLRFYKHDELKIEKLRASPGGWHNSLERLIEDASVNPYSTHIVRKKSFSLKELMAGRFANEEEFNDVWNREVQRLENSKKRRQQLLTKKFLTEEEEDEAEFMLDGAEPGEELEERDSVLPLRDSAFEKLDVDAYTSMRNTVNNRDNEEEIPWKNPRLTRNTTENWSIPTKIRTVFIATDNCTKIEEFQHCEAYTRNKWTIKSFCRRLVNDNGVGRLPDSSKTVSKKKTSHFSEGIHGIPLDKTKDIGFDSLDEVVDDVLTGEVDMSEFENIRWTAEMARSGVWSHPKRGTGADDMMRLWAEITILTKASFVIGTFTSNMGRLVQILRTQPQDTMESLDIRWKPG